MIGFQPSLLVLGISVVTSLGVGFYVGWDWQGARCAESRVADVEEYNQALEGALVTYAAKAKKEQARAVLAAEERRAKSAVAQGVIREAATQSDDGSCDWSDAQRLRLKQLYETYGVAGE